MWRKIFIFALIVAMQCSVSIISIGTVNIYAQNSQQTLRMKLYQPAVA